MEGALLVCCIHSVESSGWEFPFSGRCGSATNLDPGRRMWVFFHCSPSFCNRAQISDLQMCVKFTRVVNFDLLYEMENIAAPNLDPKKKKRFMEWILMGAFIRTRTTNPRVF